MGRGRVFTCEPKWRFSSIKNLRYRLKRWGRLKKVSNRRGVLARCRRVSRIINYDKIKIKLIRPHALASHVRMVLIRYVPVRIGRNFFTYGGRDQKCRDFETEIALLYVLVGR